MHVEKIIQKFKDGLFLRNALAIAFVLGVIYSFLYGLWLIPFSDIGFVRAVPATPWDYLFVLGVSLLGGLAMQTARSGAANASGALGGVGGFFAAACSSCFGITFVALGATAFLPLHALIPYLDYLKVAVLALLAFSFYAGISETCMTKGALRARQDKFVRTFARRGNILPTAFSVMPVALLLLLSVLLLGFQATQVVALQAPALPSKTSDIVSLDGFSTQVLPADGYVSKAKWGTVIGAMVKAKVLDPQKLEQVLQKRYGQKMKPEWRKLLEAEKSDEYIKIDNENAVFMMYLLWTFAKQNQNEILLSSPFAPSFENYDIGVGKPGYGDTPLLELSGKPLETARLVAENSFRPCCGQSAARPDCSHGFSLLGLIEIGASQGLTKEQLFEDSKGFNAFWYPAHYIQLAQYFKQAEGKDWKDVDAEKVMSYDYSSIAGARRIQQQLART